MNILPKILYLFGMLPIPIPPTHLKKLQTDILVLFGITKGTEYQNNGCLVLLNLLKYYQATQLRAIALFTYNCWMKIEKLWLTPFHSNNLLWNADAIVDSSNLLQCLPQTTENVNSLWSVKDTET